MKKEYSYKKIINVKITFEQESNIAVITRNCRINTY